jgi:hypothetical protein
MVLISSWFEGNTVKKEEKRDAFVQHEGKVAEAGDRFAHVMAVTLDPQTGYKNGIIRCITSREGEYGVAGQLDRSALFNIKTDSPDTFEITEELNIKHTEDIIAKLKGEGGDFIGLEDPDIWRDEKTGLMHVYFTMPVKLEEKDAKGNDIWNVHLGHAVGKDLDSLEMTEPTLLGNAKMNAKEVSIAPQNSEGFRYNLFESSDERSGEIYSVVRVAIARDMGKPWEFGEIAFHPADHNIPWIAGHASPGPLLPKSFVDVGENKLLGIMNGCEANKREGDKIIYGAFTAGLYIYDYEKGTIDWVSPEPLIWDTEAGAKRPITFASQFVEGFQGEGTLYAHVDDSFVRAYTLDAEALKALVPEKSQ